MTPDGILARPDPQRGWIGACIQLDDASPDAIGPDALEACRHLAAPPIGGPPTPLPLEGIAKRSHHPPAARWLYLAHPDRMEVRRATRPGTFRTVSTVPYRHDNRTHDKQRSTP